MRELLLNAWSGWLQFTSGGKLAALLLLSLIFLWLGGKWKKEPVLYSYTVSAALCCIVPVTAAALMLYQTKFYDYEWIWSLVPMTAVTAWAAVEFLCLPRHKFESGRRREALSVSVLLLAVLVLCSGPGSSVYDRRQERQDRLRAQEVMTLLAEQGSGPFCLWAPREILEHARELDPSVELLYGRNMWDISLNSYLYDTYSEDLQDLYLWMENTDETGLAVGKDPEGRKVILQGEDCINKAVSAGANCIILPERMNSESVEELAEALGGSARRLEHYYLLTR